MTTLPNPFTHRCYKTSRASHQLHTQDPIVRLPEDVIMAARVSLLLRGTAQLMAQEQISTAAAWRGEAERVVQQQLKQGSNNSSALGT